MEISQYLDLAMKKRNLRSDNQLSKELGWSKSKVNNFRHNRQAMDNESCRIIAEVIEIPVWEVIADMELYRAEKQNDEVKKKSMEKIVQNGWQYIN
jgi:ribosome-binding protein aMBF1 (putative translation factor)